jgi:ketosteroid isomerase-like protein
MKKRNSTTREQKLEQNLSEKKKKFQKINELHRKDKEASIKGDFATLITLLTDDCVLLPPDSAPIAGKDAIQKYFDEQKELLSDIEITEYTHDFQEIKICGNWAYEWGYFSNKAKSAAEEDPIKSSGILFRILELQDDGTWKVARSIWNMDPELKNLNP